MLAKRSLFFRYIVCFVPGVVFPVGGLLLKFDDFSLVLNILSLQQRLIGFHST